MKYASNILPTQEAFYTFVNATINNGILEIGVDGSATCVIDPTMLAALTSTMRLSIFSNTTLDAYNPAVQVQITAISDDGIYYNYTCTPAPASDGIYNAMPKFENAKYSYMSVTFKASSEVSLTLWELCPEATDESISIAIEGVEQSLPKLLFDYNTWPFTIGQFEDTIALISYNLQANSDLQGHFQMAYVASQPCTLTLRFKDNGATELFCPLVYDLHAGRGNIGVPHAYINRLAGSHNIIVTAQITAGTITVDTRGLLFTIDGGYLAERTIDVGSDIRDITVRQSHADAGPSEVWIIGIENGEALVRKRDYAETSTAGYSPVYAIGEAKDAAIEFDGDWVRRASDDKHTIETYDAPYIFFIDMNDDLVVQLGGDESTRYVLDHYVSSMSVCRGYKSVNYPANDQGLICAYLKRGIPYYRAYIYQEALGTYVWDYPRPISAHEALNIQVHRLNDYRVGIVVTTAEQNLWYISDRTYVEQSSKSERAHMSLSVPEAFCSLYPIVPVYAPSYVTGYEVLDGSKTRLIVTCNYPIRCTKLDIAKYITLNGCSNCIEIEHIDITDNVLSIDVNLVAFSDIYIDIEDFRFMHKIPGYGWVFITGTSWTISVPSAVPDYVSPILLNNSATCSLIPIRYRTVTQRREAALYALSSNSYTCEQIRIKTISKVQGHIDTASLVLSDSSATLMLIKVGLEPI